ncbi:MAG: hypothetical protein ABEI80_09760 [Haloplanus sp.]
MDRPASTVLAAPETYVLFLVCWYVTYLTLGIPTLPGWAHVLGAVTFGGALAGIALATVRLDSSRVRRTLYRLTALFVAGALVASTATAMTPHTIKSFTRTTVAGRIVVSTVGACLFAGALVGVATLLRTLNRRRPQLG